MRKYIILFLLIISLGFISCEKYLEPYGENSLSQSQLVFNPAYAEGPLIRAYAYLPSAYNFETDIASDDAVTNDQTSTYRRMAVGEWKATFNPIETWTSSYLSIYYINKFLDLYQSVKWSQDSSLPRADRNLRTNLYIRRLKGEAYALRAYYYWRILQYHGGIGTSGQLLGFPIIDHSIATTDNWQLPRNTFTECVSFIFNDLDTARKYLPATWFDRATNRATDLAINLPVNGPDPVVNASNTKTNHVNDSTNKANKLLNLQCGDTNIAMGARYENRLNGNTATALKARVALLAASPAFSASGMTMAQAATIAGPLLKSLGALYANGRVFYKEIKNKEIIWNRAQSNIRDWETSNFPPSLFGSGRTNPSQNLVDAFSMVNGYPITNPLSLYNPNKPYKGRDPRFTDYIVYDSAVLKSTVIRTYIGAPSDGINVLTTSTRTGYYLKKLLLENVNLNPNSTLTSSAHTFVFVRMTELLLNFAEAYNEAWGPDVDHDLLGFTARSKMRELRVRAGITQPDLYLNSLDQAGLRTLIRNERRIELCFEGFRFWDIRRWGDVTTMQAPVQAVNITKTTGINLYNFTNIEERKFTADMIYGPVPYSETLKYNLEQNKGW